MIPKDHGGGVYLHETETRPKVGMLATPEDSGPLGKQVLGLFLRGD